MMFVRPIVRVDGRKLLHTGQPAGDDSNLKAPNKLSSCMSVLVKRHKCTARLTKQATLALVPSDGNVNYLDIISATCNFPVPIHGLWR